MRHNLSLRAELEQAKRVMMQMGYLISNLYSQLNIEMPDDSPQQNVVAVPEPRQLEGNVNVFFAPQLRQIQAAAQNGHGEPVVNNTSGISAGCGN
jgi:hypothetical protein